MAFETITETQRSAFVSSLLTGQYNLLLGSGISLDSHNSDGYLPSAGDLRRALTKLKSTPSESPLQRVFGLLSTDEIREHVTSKYIDCSPGPSITPFPSFLWNRMFTFNIDDAMEAGYRDANGLQTLRSINFDDQFVDPTSPNELQIIHLHGYSQLATRGYVFSRESYVRQMSAHNVWMTILAQLIKTDPFVIIGTSLDEPDLDYYLAHRTQSSARDDRGPSILVCPDPNPITRNDCVEYGLLLFRGTCKDFLKYCDEVLPARKSRRELIPTDEDALLPDEVPSPLRLSFWSDFSLVPTAALPQAGLSRFQYGHPPSWADLAADLDVPRSATARIISSVERSLNENAPDEPRLLLVFDGTGTGKTTILSRCAFELSKRSITTLRCTATSRLEPKNTAAVLDSIPDPLVLIVDDFADQANQVANLLDETDKSNMVILGAERGYRKRYVTQALAGASFVDSSVGHLGTPSVGDLIDNYTNLGLVGSGRAFSDRTRFSRELAKDPIAIACCRILNDFRPLRRIVSDVLDDADDLDVDRYAMAALAEHCCRAGVRYSTLAGAMNADGMKEQLSWDHPLPLACAASGVFAFIVPQNSTFGTQVLRSYADANPSRMLEVFVRLANAIAPRVNRHAIRRRVPEARLAGRLFDFDDVVQNFLDRLSLEFYVRTQSAWQWNSRYWEQLALLHLSTFYSNPGASEGTHALDTAVQHARHAVSVETHPFPLTTLARTLLAQMSIEGSSAARACFDEAFDRLDTAIRLERDWGRVAVQPFVVLFRGANQFSEAGSELTGTQARRITELLDEADQRFRRDTEVQAVISALRPWLR